MSVTDTWLNRYAASQQALAKPVVYWTATPMLVIGLVAALWALPVPARFHEISPLLNWGSAFLMVTAIYYFIISLPLAIGMLPVLLALAALPAWFAKSAWPLHGIATGLLVAGAAGLALGRSFRLRAIVEDLQLLMIGPAWLMASVYRRFGIPL